MRGRGTITRTAWATLALLAACGGGGDGGGSTTLPPVVEPPAGRPTLPQTYRASGHAAAGDVFVHLFSWRWTDVASECEAVLGPAGVNAVQVSPPQEHAVVTGRPWWERYQPVSYALESRSGTAVQFADMVSRCAAAGVDVYVDAVVNHMTAGGGTGSGGTAYTKYSYPPLYAQADFHAQCDVSNYANPANVQDCELVGLADLHTGRAETRAKIADYLLSLSRMGVAGFRLDAAKHVQPAELDSIVARVNRTLAAEGRARPYWFAEVIGSGGEGVVVRDYFGLGYASGGAADITEFIFRGVGDKFSGAGGQRISQLDPAGPNGSRFSAEAWGMMPGDKAVVFLQNHDTQRAGGLDYRDGDAYRLAHVWMLAQPYGHPKILSGYAFDLATQAGRDAGPPSAGGAILPVTCPARMEDAAPGQWTCEHRDPMILRMVAFRRAAGDVPVAHWWSNGASALAFARGDRGWVAISRETAPVAATVQTGMAPGAYCDILTGGRAGAACAGTRVDVAADGTVALDLAPNSAVAIVAASRL